MKRILIWLKKINYKVAIPLIIILILGAFLRFYNLPQNTYFNADQEELAFKAAEILNGDLVLLGPKTSIGGFCIGPYFTYLWAISSFFVGGDPIAGAYLSIFLGLLVIIGFYILGKWLFNENVGFILAGLVSFSPVIVSWDQNPWAPSIFYISELILLAGAYLVTKKPIGLVVFALGFLIGFSSHFGIFLSLLSVLVFWVLVRPKITKKYLIISLAVIFLGLMPNIIFDAIHSLENIKRIFATVADDSNLGASTGKILLSLGYSNVSVFYSHLTKITATIIFFTFVSLGGYFAVKDKLKRSLLILLLVSILVPPLVFVFYRPNFSEYYLMMTIPPFIILFGYFISKVKGRLIIPIFGLIFTILFIGSLKESFLDNSLSLGAKKKAVTLIGEMAGESGYGVSLTTSPGQNFGFKYIFEHFGLSPDIPPAPGEKNVMTIVIPIGYEGVETKRDFSGVGVLWEGPMFESY